MFLIFDTETTGLPRDYNAPLTNFDNWPRMVQLAWQMHDYTGQLVEAQNFIIRPDGFTIPFNSEKIHGISTQMAMERGKPIAEVLEKFRDAIERSTHIAGHNIEFDLKIAGSEFLRNGSTMFWETGKHLTRCTRQHNFVRCLVVGEGHSNILRWQNFTSVCSKKTLLKRTTPPQMWQLRQGVCSN